MSKAKVSDVDPGYPVHEAVYAFPPVTGERRAAMKTSIQESGIIEPLVSWTDPRGKTAWIDGRTRLELWRELRQEGNLPPHNAGLPYYELEGCTPEQMLGYVLVKNRERRHLTSGQLACVEVELNALWNKYRKARKAGKTGDEPTRSSDGDAAEKLAEDAGTNRSYIFAAANLREQHPGLYEACKRDEIALSAADELAKSHPDLATAVDEGRRTIAEVQEKLKNRRAAERRQVRESTNGNGEAGHAEAAQVEDGEGNPVADKALAEIFAARGRVAEISSELRSLRRKVADLCDGPGGARMDRGYFQSRFNELLSELGRSQPHVACPACGGTGKAEKGKRAKCPTCEGARFLDVRQHRAAESAAI